MLHQNSRLLVERLESTQLLDGRFSSLKLMNLPNGVKRGFFSLVFKAWDEIQEREVALKFFDIAPQKLRENYRVACFEREHELLDGIRGAPRCLQVQSDFSIYKLLVDVAGCPDPIEIAAPYFATDWLDGDIDEYFLAQDSVDAIDKLHIFNEVVLAIESLHLRSVFHRDVKVDNFRSRIEVERREIVAIDLGTAARHDSPPMLDTYGAPVGMVWYSAPEARCGLSGCRTVAPLNDVYALGCMLYEMFHPDDFPTAHYNANPAFDAILLALQSRIDLTTQEAVRISAWRREAPKLLRGVASLSLDDNESTAPASIRDIVDRLFKDMTEPDFTKRIASFPRIRMRIWTAIRVLENQALAKKRAEIAAKKRAARAAKAATKMCRVRLEFDGQLVSE